MSYIDVLIPGVIGFLLLAAPNAFSKSTGDLEADAPRHAKLRFAGLGLLCVAAIYFMIKLASQA
jgi:hypothetical protein